MPHQPVGIAVGGTQIDGTVRHAVGYGSRTFRLGKGGHHAVDGHLARLYIVQVSHRVHAPLVVKEQGLVIGACH